MRSGGCSQSDRNSSLLEELTQLFQVSNLTCASHLGSQGTVLQKEGRVFIRSDGLPVDSPVLAQGRAPTEILPRKRPIARWELRVTSLTGGEFQPWPFNPNLTWGGFICQISCVMF